MNPSLVRGITPSVLNVSKFSKFFVDNIDALSDLIFETSQKYKQEKRYHFQ